MKQQGYIRSLDGVRALAIILVMAFHAGILHFGWMGVQLFFVLSGYLITGILWEDKSRPGTISTKLKNFWARRSLRIFPLYFGFILVIGFIYLISGFPSYFPASAPYLFTYTYNYTRLVPGWEGNPLFTHLWSLSIEEQFYFFYPFIIFFLKPKMVKWILVVCIVLTPLIRFLLFELYKTEATTFAAADAVYWNTMSHLDAFFLGGLIPVMSLNAKIKRPHFLMFGALAFVIAAGVFNYVANGSTSFFWTDLGYDHEKFGYGAPIWKFTILNLFFASLILCLTSNRLSHVSVINRFFSSRWMVRIGKVSYGMYIFHWAVFVYLFAHLYPVNNKMLNTIMFFPYVLVVYLLAEASFSLYESKLLRLKDRFFPMKPPSEEAHLDFKAEEHSKIR